MEWWCPLVGHGISTEKKIKTFIVRKTMPTYVTASFEVVAKNEKEAYDKFIKVYQR
jgi:hypothetical protein